MVDVDEEKRGWIYKDYPEGLRVSRKREEVIREKEGIEANFGRVSGGGTYMVDPSSYP
jgi:hypothetical protein